MHYDLLSDASIHVPIQVDVSSSASVDQMVSYIEEHIGRCPTGVVNSAGIGTRHPGRRSCLDCTEAIWNDIISVNLTVSSDSRQIKAPRI